MQQVVPRHDDLSVNLIASFYYFCATKSIVVRNLD